jgi:regulator of protease activity HflC (stomatin/prohibitin superfamily)
MTNENHQGTGRADVRAAIDTIVDNSVASMAIEGFMVPDEEVARVRAKAHAELADRVQVLTAQGGKL